MTSSEGSDVLRDELTWIHLKESSFTDKAKSKGWSMYLVPLGCAATVGVLGRGLYYLYRRDSTKQQLFMRYRVLAQGITVAIAIFGMFQIQKEHNLKAK